MAARIARSRVFPTSGSMVGASSLDLSAHMLVVSQMALVADTARGTRPNLAAGMDPVTASQLYRVFVVGLEDAGVVAVQVVPFGSSIEIEMRHWGPFTLVLDG